ncbi:MAG: hypothetical protein HYT38_02705 [Candidatus Sungbacteria bacterium]|uniref:Uncharacterized protein n=1 Tax=Candidatus Sungiibacteriota bacterium TaxID=2750080 RepID=A0A9D6DPL6_9BACT|nr:hypothetical protein [Candidatus Sungbacteria bacterium]
MSDDIKELLRKNLEVSERTLQLVQKMHRAALWSRFFSLLKWVIIIGATVWGYLAIQPFLRQLLGFGQQIGDLQKSLPSSGGFDSLLKSFLGK